MPELPEVETVVRGIRPDLVGHTITDAWLDWSPGLVTPDSQSFLPRLRGQKVQEVNRRAKYIVIKLDADWLMIHLKMTGRLYIVPDNAEHESDRWVHFRFQLENEHQLRFSDSRKFGKVYLTGDLEPYLGHLGPEPLDDTFTVIDFQKRLERRKGRIKPVLLNQEFIAGVGNIYADEVLHCARIHPLRTVDTLIEDEITALYTAIRDVLRKGIERQGASIGWYRTPEGERGSMQDDFFVYGRTGEACRNCESGMIEKIVVAQRGTHFCPHCQR